MTTRPECTIFIDAGYSDASDLLSLSARIDSFAIAAANEASPCPLPAMSDFEPVMRPIRASLRQIPGGGRLMHIAHQSTDNPNEETIDASVVEWRLEDHPYCRDTKLIARWRTDGRGMPVGHGGDPSKWDDAAVLASYAKLVRAHLPRPRGSAPSPCPDIDTAIATVISSMVDHPADADAVLALLIKHPSPFGPGSLRYTGDTRWDNTGDRIRAPAWLDALPYLVRITVNDAVSNQAAPTRPVTIVIAEPKERWVNLPPPVDAIGLLRVLATLPRQDKLAIISQWNDEYD